jgi:hypothetical protein
MAVEFVLTEDHLKLIGRMYVGWSDVEYGAPEINPNRPYGNSMVEYDIAEILGWGIPDEDSDHYTDEALEALQDRAEKIHKETQTALQIILCTKSFEPGLYIKEDRYDDRSWKRVGV